MCTIRLISSSFFDLFASAAGRFADRTAVEVQGREHVRRVTYGELRDVAERTSAWLRARGLRQGDRVAIIADNDDRWCGVYLGVLRTGGVAVPLDTSYTPEQIATVLRDSGAAGIFTGPRFAGGVDAARRSLGAAGDRLFVVLLHGDPGGGVTPFDGILAHEWCPIDAAIGRDDPAVILYTSGTTSDPKGVVLTHGNLVAERTGAFRLVRVDERDAILGVLPLFHALAQMANLLLPFTVGARVVFLETVNTTELTRALKERGITTFVCVPQFFYLLHERIEQEVASLPLPARALVRGLAGICLRWREWTGLNPGRLLFGRIHRSLGPEIRLLVTGGARFDPDVNRALYGLGFTIRQAYGLTECSGAATLTDDGDPHLRSVGRPLPGVEIRIDPAPDGVTRSAGDAPDGEILIRGAIVMRGYHDRPDQNAWTLRDGWLRTGDLGYTDRAGRLFITGRSKEVIVLGSGKNIHPEEIEAHYQKSPFIEELCVVGLSRPGQPAADKLHALVRPDAEAMRARGAVNIRELLRFEIESLSVQLPPHKRILGYDVALEPLPRTTTRKLKRFEIERELREIAGRAERPSPDRTRETGAADPSWPDDPHTARILALVRDVVPAGRALRPDAHLELDLGLDSMERVELLVHLAGSLGIEIPDEEAQRIHTAGDLVGACLAHAGDAHEHAEGVLPWMRLLEQPPADSAVLAELSKPKRKRALLLFAAVKLLFLVFKVTTGLRARGRDCLPESGPYLISPNHQSYLDAFLLVGALPFRAFRELFFVGAAEYFRTPLMAWVARTANVIPVDPDANLVGAMQAGAHGLRLGKVLVLFPEGERSIDGTVKTFRKGAAILAHHARVPIVPVAIDGAWDVWARGRSIRWRSLVPLNGTRARIAFARPLPPPASPAYQGHTEALRDQVTRLWDELHRERTAAPSA